MFNLNKTVADWRCRMRAEGIHSIDALDELESHLRDEIDRQLRLGADEEQAYEAAAAAIGEVATLKAEFSKLKRADEGWRKFLRIFYFGSVAFVLLSNTWTLLAYELSLLERFAGISIASVITLFLACLPSLLRSLAAAAYARLLKIIKTSISFVWLWSIWALLEATHLVHWEIGIVPTMVFWCLCAGIGLAALACALTDRRLPNDDSGGSPPMFQPSPHPIAPTPPTPPDVGIPLPHAQRFAPVASEALQAACEEALRLGHDFIGTEHVLLGVLKLAKGAFANMLEKNHLDHETARLEIERIVAPVPGRKVGSTPPLTPRARKALQFAAKEADALDHSSISAEHIFLGLLVEKGGVAGQVLRRLGIRLKRARDEVSRELGTQPNC
jgi:hypothetical protein